MKIKLIILCLFCCSFFQLNAQDKNNHIGDKVQIRMQDTLKSEKLNIKLFRENSKENSYLIFSNNQILKSGFPNDSGIYKVQISYGKEFYYQEIFIYNTAPSERELLTFDFYPENNRIFCKITSNLSGELNKEIVLNKVPNKRKK